MKKSREEEIMLNALLAHGFAFSTPLKLGVTEGLKNIRILKNKENCEHKHNGTPIEVDDEQSDTISEVSIGITVDTSELDTALDKANQLLDGMKKLQLREEG